MFVHILKAGTTKYLSVVDGGHADVELTNGPPTDNATFDLQGVNPTAGIFSTTRRINNSADYALCTYRNAYVRAVDAVRSTRVDARGTFTRGRLRLMRFGPSDPKPFGRGTIQNGADIAIGVRYSASRYRWLQADSNGALSFSSPAANPGGDPQKFQFWIAPTISGIGRPGTIDPVPVDLLQIDGNGAPPIVAFALTLSAPAPPGGTRLQLKLDRTADQSLGQWTPLPEGFALRSGAITTSAGTTVPVVVPQGSSSASGFIVSPTARPNACQIFADSQILGGSLGLPATGQILAEAAAFGGWLQRDLATRDDVGTFRGSAPVLVRLRRGALTLAGVSNDDFGLGTILGVPSRASGRTESFAGTVMNVRGFLLGGRGPFRLMLSTTAIPGRSTSDDLAGMSFTPGSEIELTVRDGAFSQPFTLNGIAAAKDCVICVKFIVLDTDPNSLKPLVAWDCFGLRLLPPG